MKKASCDFAYSSQVGLNDGSCINTLSVGRTNKSLCGFGSYSPVKYELSNESHFFVQDFPPAIPTPAYGLGLGLGCWVRVRVRVRVLG